MGKEHERSQISSTLGRYMLLPESKAYLREYGDFHIIEEDREANFFTFEGALKRRKRDTLTVDVQLSRDGRPRFTRTKHVNRHLEPLLDTHVISHGDIDKTLQVEELSSGDGKAVNLVSCRLGLKKDLGIHIWWDYENGLFVEGEIQDVGRHFGLRSASTKEGEVCRIDVDSGEKVEPISIVPDRRFSVSVADDDKVFVLGIDPYIDIEMYHALVNTPDRSWMNVFTMLPCDLAILQSPPSDTRKK